MSALAVRPSPRPLTAGRVTRLGAALLLHGAFFAHAVHSQDVPLRPQPATAPAGPSSTPTSAGTAITVPAGVSDATACGGTAATATPPATSAAATPPAATDAAATRAAVSGATTSAPATHSDAFPAAWLGRWKGAVEVLGGTGGGTGFTMELRIAPTERPDAYTWTIIYDGQMGRQERPYLLRVKDAVRGEYVIDEVNGILLPTRLIGDTLFSSFVVQGARVSVREQLRDAGTPQERIEVELLTLDEGAPVRSGGTGGVPEVLGWSPRSLQRAVLRRE